MPLDRRLFVTSHAPLRRLPLLTTYDTALKKSSDSSFVSLER